MAEVVGQELFSRMYGSWLKEDMPVIEQMHPNSVVIPMYRAALVLLDWDPEHKTGDIKLRIYHDPAWLGEETTPETLEGHCWDATLIGQRDGPMIHHKSSCECSRLDRRLILMPTSKDPIGEERE